MIRKKHPS